MKQTIYKYKRPSWSPRWVINVKQVRTYKALFETDPDGVNRAGYYYSPIYSVKTDNVFNRRSRSESLLKIIDYFKNYEKDVILGK